MLLTSVNRQLAWTTVLFAIDEYPPTVSWFVSFQVNTLRFQLIGYRSIEIADECKSNDGKCTHTQSTCLPLVKANPTLTRTLLKFAISLDWIKAWTHCLMKDSRSLETCNLQCNSQFKFISSLFNELAVATAIYPMAICTIIQCL